MEESLGIEELVRTEYYNKKININTYASLLYSVSEKGNLEKVQYLIRNYNIINSYNDYALRAAVKKRHQEVAQFLLENGANVHANWNEALRNATKNKDEDMKKLLLAHGAVYPFGSFKNFITNCLFDNPGDMFSIGKMLFMLSVVLMLALLINIYNFFIGIL